MFLVLLVVPALVAVQADVARPFAALRRGLSSRAGDLRWLTLGLGAAQILWLALTVGYAMAVGALHPVLRAAAPELVEMDPLRAGLLLFVIGAVLLSLMTYVTARILGGRRAAI